MRFWPFGRRKPAPPQHVGPDAVDWRPGDMAECIFCPPVEEQVVPWPEVGDRLMVTYVGYGMSISGSFNAFFLVLLGMQHVGYRADCFRKITLTDTGADRKVGNTAPRAKEPVHG